MLNRLPCQTASVLATHALSLLGFLVCTMTLGNLTSWTRDDISFEEMWVLIDQLCQGGFGDTNPPLRIRITAIVFQHSRL